MNYSSIYATCSNADEAKKISLALLKSRLVACVNVMPKITSYYYWKGDLQQDNEVLLIAKTKKSLVDLVISKVKELHSYDIPCVLVFEIKGGNNEYLEWIEKSC